MEASLNEWEVLGVDVNASTNFMKLSDGGTIGLSRALANRVNRMKRDFVGKEINGNKKMKKKFEKRKEKIERNSDFHLERKVKELIDYAKEKGYKHLVLEDTFGMEAKLDGDLSGWIGLGELKEEIAKQDEIAVSLVHPQFTSITCPHCFHTASNNRPTRDRFQCEHCGYRSNADKIAAINIKRRVTEPILRERLEVFDGTRYMPKEGITAQDIFDAYDALSKEKYEERKERRATAADKEAKEAIDKIIEEMFA